MTKVFRTNKLLELYFYQSDSICGLSSNFLQVDEPQFTSSSTDAHDHLINQMFMISLHRRARKILSHCSNLTQATLAAYYSQEGSLALSGALETFINVPDEKLSALAKRYKNKKGLMFLVPLALEQKTSPAKLLNSAFDEFEKLEKIYNKEHPKEKQQ